ncbi:hypothetical protein L195_g004914, partial [Trifolium pratense]
MPEIVIGDEIRVPGRKSENEREELERESGGVRKGKEKKVEKR